MNEFKDGLGSMMAEKKRQCSYTISEKLAAIDRVNCGETKAKVSKDLGINDSTLRGWLQSESKLRGFVKEINDATRLERKRVRFSGKTTTDKALGKQKGKTLINLSLRAQMTKHGQHGSDSLMADNRCQRSYTVEEKLVAVGRVHHGETKAKVSKDLDINDSTLRGWLRSESKLRGFVKEINSVTGLGRKRVRFSVKAGIDKALLKWFLQEKEKGKPVSHLSLQVQAGKIGRLLGDKSFHASWGFVSRFKRRHGISKSFGESWSVSEYADAFISELRFILQNENDSEELHEKCDVCRKIFQCLSILERLVITCTGENLYQCKLCQKSFIRPSALMMHMRDHIEVTRVKCRSCHKLFTQLQRYSRSHITKSKFKRKKSVEVAESFTVMHYGCLICDEMFDTWTEFLQHCSNHGSTPPDDNFFTCITISETWPHTATSLNREEVEEKHHFS